MTGPSRRYVAVLAISALATDAAVASEPVQFIPSSKWVIDFADDSCSSRRMFEHGGKNVFLEFRNYAPGTQMEVSVGSDSVALKPKNPETRFLPDPDLETHDFYVTMDGGNGWKAVQIWDSLAVNEVERRNFGSNKPPEKADSARISAISAYEVRDLFDQDVELMVGPLDKVDSALDACLDDLVSSWGIDPKVQKTLTRMITWNGNEGWMSRLGRAQAEVLRNKSIGQLHLRAMVDETGHVSSCRIAEFPSPSDENGQKLCTVLDRAEFAPALDANGRPVKSFILLPLAATHRTEYRFTPN